MLPLTMQPADVMDRLTILLLHLLHGNDSVEKEYLAVLAEAKRIDPGVWEFIALFTHNSAIWKLESAIRQGKEDSLAKDEIGARALEIRDLNRRRCAVKNLITERLGGFQQAKTDHASA